ncbi:testis-specific protein 10-interacting protein isoform X2 [Tamandua tetradactyla]|uniref:testis-specific protein 10-interacting protein isoform X2 n=1 Tax=Tamandua tetradactyla TaxID=48850 RepID=UPI004053A75F
MSSLEAGVKVQGSLGSGDGVLVQGRQRRSRSAEQTAKKDRGPSGRSKKGLLPSPPRKPSFPFQWAWESFLTDGRPLRQPRAPAGPVPARPPLPPAGRQARPQHRPRRRTAPTASLPGPHGLRGTTEPPGAQGRRRPGAGGAKGERPGPEPRGERGLWPPRKSADSECEAAEEEAPGAREAGRALSPGELPPLLRRGPPWEEEGSCEETEEGEDGVPRAPRRGRAHSRRKGKNSGEELLGEGDLQGRSPGSCPSSSNLQGAHGTQTRAEMLEGPWDLEKLQRQLQRDLEERGLCGPQKQPWKVLRAAVQATRRGGKTHALGDDETFLSASFPNRTFHKRQEATRKLLKTWEQQQQEEQQRAEMRRAREQRVQQQVARCLAAYVPRGSRGPGAAQSKLEELRENGRRNWSALPHFTDEVSKAQGGEGTVQYHPVKDDPS